MNNLRKKNRISFVILINLTTTDTPQRERDTCVKQNNWHQDSNELSLMRAIHSTYIFDSDQLASQ